MSAGNRRLKRAAIKAEAKKHKKARDLGACFHSGCQNNGDETFHCRTCESLDKGEKTFRIQTCFVHKADAVAKIKTHALVKHPSNILRVAVAAIKGDLKGDV